MSTAAPTLSAVEGIKAASRRLRGTLGLGGPGLNDFACF